MLRSALALVTLTVLLTAGVAAVQNSAPAAPAGVTAADAAAFIGDWTLNMESPNGPAAMTLSIKPDAGKVVGEISSDMMPKTLIDDIAKSGTNLVLRYNFDYQGQPIPVVGTLSPTADKIGATMDFAGGAFLMTGAATKAAAK